MSNAILVHGLIGSGKTSTCIDFIEMLRSIKQNTGGILCKRVCQEGELIGYDCLDVSSGRVFPLVRLRSQVCGPEWFNFKDLKYAFSLSGFRQANRTLIRLSEGLNVASIVFIDEFGKLEKAGGGIYPGVMRVLGSLSKGSVVLITCRSDVVETVETLLEGRVQKVFKCESGNLEKLLNISKQCLS